MDRVTLHKASSFKKFQKYDGETLVACSNPINLGLALGLGLGLGIPFLVAVIVMGIVLGKRIRSRTKYTLSMEGHSDKQHSK